MNCWRRPVISNAILGCLIRANNSAFRNYGAMPTLVVGMLERRKIPSHAHGKREHGTLSAILLLAGFFQVAEKQGVSFGGAGGIENHDARHA
jgi:hypothetical protein